MSEPLNLEVRGAEKAIALRERWTTLPARRRMGLFQSLPREAREAFYLSLPAGEQQTLLNLMPAGERRSWPRLLAPDDAADLMQLYDPDQRKELMALIDEDTRRDVEGLLAYAEDQAGGLMSPRFIRLRPDICVEVAIRYLRAQARLRVETLQYAYVLSKEQTLLGAVSFPELLMAPPDEWVENIMTRDLVTVPEDMDQREVTRRFAETGLAAIPVIDDQKRMKGIVTLDDIVDVVEEMATEDIQKLGGSEALDEPYPEIGFFKMIKKRAGWLTILFLGEMLTATAMGYFEKEIERAVVLALFIPLIISSGGNSGSQATSLIIRALALREIRLSDWWKVFLRELGSGLALGVILGSIGLLRILLWPTRNTTYGEHYIMIAATVACSLIGVVLWGSLAGSMLPFILRKAGFDPATASAPFVATLVDVTGLIIYFTVASLILGGTLL
jgi:magnesium transporter